jgi:hypothetical protein
LGEPPNKKNTFFILFLVWLLVWFMFYNYKYKYFILNVNILILIIYSKIIIFLHTFWFSLL